MEETYVAENMVVWADLIRRKRKAKLLELFKQSQAIEVASFLEKQKSVDLVLSIMLQLPDEFCGEIFIEFDDEFQIELYKKWDKKIFARVFSRISSRHRANFFALLSDREQARLLPFLSKNVREDIAKLNAYDSESVGSGMSTDFATIVFDMNVRKAIAKLRQDAPSKKMIYYIYVVDRNMKLLGFVSLKDLVMNPPESLVEDLLHENFSFAYDTDNKEHVAKQIEDYDLLAIPIVNEDKQLVGILRYDDAMDIIRAEETEDMEKFMGIISDEEVTDYNSTTVFQHFKRRIVWIVVLFISSSLSELLLHKNAHILSRFIELSLYLTMITGAGGNAGSQAATVVIRALSMGHVKVNDWVKIIFKESRIACLISLCLFLIAYVKVIVFSTEKTDYTFTLALTISIALALQVVSSAVVGASLPIIAKYFKGDPAVAASPAITTLVDITGMIIYFSVASMILF